ncbi:acyltransferase [Sinorhizobium sp. BG8]|uniref:acyltransferase family protein n=1 Tax=Sinorhizobium sp. BG8 TaxID=2613773 RepID=UPI00193D777B|nr:acyltransferase [Sinorhizobium sp. BG8]
MPQTSFSIGLSALRGFAALGVVVYHTFVMLPVGGIEAPDELRIDLSNGPLLLQHLFLGAFNGRGLVVLFFVLSGCVLCISINRRQHFGLRRIPGYLVRRGARLYPLLILSATIAALLQLFFFKQTGLPGASAWANTQHVTPEEWLWREWFVNAIGHSSNLNTPAWSISVELLGSFIFPAIYFLAVRPKTAVFAVVASIALMYFTPGDPRLYYRMNLYTFCFVMGALVPLYGERLIRVYDRLPRLIRRIALVVAVLTFMFARPLVAPTGTSSTVILMETISATFIVALVLFRPAPSILKTGVAQEIGRISYGIYLFHLLVIFVVAHALMPLMRPDGTAEEVALLLVLGISSLAVTLVLAWIVHRVFEVRMQNLGRRIGDMLDARLSPPEPNALLKSA